MYAKPIHCNNCKHWHGGTPRTKYASWCTAHEKPAVRALAFCIKEKTKEPTNEILDDNLSFLL